MADGRFPLHWQMNRQERLAILWILERIRPHLALEVGTYRGGSLQVISEYSDRVISLDIDPRVPVSLEGQFPNVEFVVGNSTRTLPDLISRLNESGETPDFVLIDGDHSTEGVKRDVNALLELVPRTEMVVLMHDSFNPNCRRGMMEVEWERSPYVHEVNIDFMPGGYSSEAYDTAEAGSMWAGLGCAILKPERRRSVLSVQASRQELFEAVEAISIHGRPAPLPPRPSLFQRIARLRHTASRIKRRALGQPLPDGS